MGLWKQIRRRFQHRIKTEISSIDSILAEGVLASRFKKFNPDHFHYRDCELYGQGPLGDSGCWCEHRGPTSHYSGGLNPGWHRKSCPMVGIAWIMPPDPKDGMEVNEYWKRPPCECRDQPDLGQFILTFQNGTVHGPAPRPMPREEDCITISGEEIRAIIDGDEET